MFGAPPPPWPPRPRALREFRGRKMDRRRSKIAPAPTGKGRSTPHTRCRRHDAGVCWTSSTKVPSVLDLGSATIGAKREKRKGSLQRKHSTCYYLQAVYKPALPPTNTEVSGLRPSLLT